MRFRILGPNAEAVFARMTGNLSETEFTIPRQIVADVTVYGQPTHEDDGAVSFGLEALTIEE